MNITIIKLEENDGVAEFIEACHESPPTDIFFCLAFDQELVPKAHIEYYMQYFGQKNVGIVYYDYIQKNKLVKYHQPFFNNLIGFTNNIAISSEALNRVLSFRKSPKDFEELAGEVIGCGYIAIHIPEVLTEYEPDKSVSQS